MAESKVDLRKEVFSKTQYTKTIDTSFNELGITTLTEELANETTVTEFFNLYNTLFYDIPAEGDINSHRYLVEQSGTYINFDEVNSEVLALREEISQLRKELLQQQMSNITDSIPRDPAGNLPPELDGIKAEFQSIVEQQTIPNIEQ